MTFHFLVGSSNLRRQHSLSCKQLFLKSRITQVPKTCRTFLSCFQGSTKYVQMLILQCFYFLHDVHRFIVAFSLSLQIFSEIRMPILRQTVQSFCPTATYRFQVYFTPRCILPLNFGPTDRLLYKIKPLSKRDSSSDRHFISLVEPTKWFRSRP